jgi:hypothetical protein
MVGKNGGSDAYKGGVKVCRVGREWRCTFPIRSKRLVGRR